LLEKKKKKGTKSLLLGFGIEIFEIYDTLNPTPEIINPSLGSALRKV
jgi:hypothetical protein